MSAPVIVSAASTVAPPANTAKRAKHAFSSSLSRLWLQSIVARSVCWRAGASRGPAPSPSSAPLRRVAISAGESSPQRAAASSIASGSPSTRRQISAIASMLSPPESKSGSCARARSQNSATASTSATAAGSAPGSGSASGGTG